MSDSDHLHSSLDDSDNNAAASPRKKSAKSGGSKKSKTTAWDPTGKDAEHIAKVIITVK